MTSSAKLRAYAPAARWLLAGFMLATAGYASADITHRVNRAGEGVAAAPVPSSSAPRHENLCSGGDKLDIVSVEPAATFSNGAAVGARYHLRLASNFGGSSRGTFTYAVYDDRHREVITPQSGPVLSLEAPLPVRSSTSESTAADVASDFEIAEAAIVIPPGLDDGFYSLLVKGAVADPADVESTSLFGATERFFRVERGEPSFLDASDYYALSRAHEAFEASSSSSSPAQVGGSR